MTITRSACLAWLLLAGVLAASPASGQMPTLKYELPAGFSGGRGWMDPQIYVDSMLEGSVEVGGFRPFQGDFRTTFLQTLFADRMSREFSQPRLLNQPASQVVSIPGAEDAMMLSFVAEQNFYTYVHTRLAVLAQGEVAIVDVRARSAERMQANWPAVSAMLQSIRVEPGGPVVVTTPTADASSHYAALAGLYVGSRLIWQGNPFGGVGSGTWMPGTYWYLLSPDGRVHRGIRLPSVTNGDITRFDYDAARRKDPANSGSFAVEGTRVNFVIGGQTLVAEVTPEGNLSIGGTTFQKARK
jgi:hypothetical protein